MKTEKLTEGTRGLLNIKAPVCGCEIEAGGTKDSALGFILIQTQSRVDPGLAKSRVAATRV